MKMHNKSNENASYSATTDSKTFPKVNLVPASALVKSKCALVAASARYMTTSTANAHVHIRIRTRTGVEGAT